MNTLLLILAVVAVLAVLVAAVGLCAAPSRRDEVRADTAAYLKAKGSRWHGIVIVADGFAPVQRAATIEVPRVDALSVYRRECFALEA